MIKKPTTLRYDRQFLKELLSDVRVPEDIGLKKCIQCGNCSSACPAARYTPYRPRKLIHDILTGQKDKILKSEDIWYCFSCFSCNLRCPRGNNPGILIHILRDLARMAGYGWKKVLPFKNYLVSLRDTGLGLTPLSTPIEAFEDELGADWAQIRRNLPEILKMLGMSSVPPRELPQEARDQIKKILELANINEEIEKFTKMEEKIEEN
ncbi:MAG: 4Fe-4S dicluster domain-containing protein [Candidatus Helarchaeota archaeon]